MKKLKNSRSLALHVLLLVSLICASLFANAQQHSTAGYHHDRSQQNSVDQELPSVCDHLHTLIKHHEQEQAHALIYETLKEHVNQPDCFFYNARLYFSHQLATREKHSRPLFDSLMVLYDVWFAASRSPTEVLNWKGRDVRDYFYKEPDSLRKYCAMYKRIYDADKNNMHPYNIKMMAFCACDLYGKIDIDTLWQFTKHQAATHHEALWKASYKSLKRELIACPKMSCKKLHGLLHPVLASGKEGSEETHKLSSLLAQRGCPITVETPQLMAVAEAKPMKAEVSSAIPSVMGGESRPNAVSDANPKAEMPMEPEKVSVSTNFYKTASVQMGNGNFKLALDNFENAMKNADSPIEKADGFLGMAIAADSLKDYVKAKEYGKEVHRLLPDESDGLKFLFDLYQKGEDICGFTTAKELAAYYVLLSHMAWNLSNIEAWEAWKENANLTELYKSGQGKQGEKVKLGCFIQEEVELP